MKTCKTCNEEKEESEFRPKASYVSVGGGISTYYESSCDDCNRAYMRGKAAEYRERKKRILWLECIPCKVEWQKIKGHYCQRCGRLGDRWTKEKTR